MHTLRQMFWLIRGQNRRLIVTIFLNTLMGLAALVPPFFMKVIVDGLIVVATNRGLAAEQFRIVLYALGGLAALRLVLVLTSFLQERMSDMLRLDAIYDLRRRMYEHVLTLSVDYYETHKVGEIVQRVTQSVFDFGIWLQDVSQQVLLRVLTIIFSVAVITLVDPFTGLVVAVTVVAKLSLALRKKMVSRQCRTRVRELLEKMQGQITESVQNLTTLRALGGEEGALRSYGVLADDLRAMRLRQHRVEWRYNAGVEAIEGAGMVAAIGLVAYAAIRGHSTPGDIVLVALYLQQVMTNLRPMATFIDQTGELMTSCERMLELLAVAPTVKDASDAIELHRLERIEFRGVGFTYPGHKAVVLKDISFEIEPGQMLALVGPSGTGKTTIVKLLLRLYEPTEGEILINGRDIRCFTSESLRRHIGTVMQDVALFNDTFAANVRLAKPEASEDALKRAIRLSHAEEFAIRLPLGYETIVGERGVKLSGGQKQRVAIARAILKRPNLVILDEATSALDSASEREVQAGLTELTTGRMSVVIAHRLSTVKRAHTILVIRQGQIAERGTHEELIAADEHYAELFRLQSS